jgi:hypothetical protein
MNPLKLVTLFLFLCLTGCLATHTGPSNSPGQVKVFGIELHSTVDYREISGVAAAEEPCLKGYERSFEPLAITIGYGFDGKIRKITTRNPKTSLFGITPGISLEEGKGLAHRAGFVDTSSPFRFKGDRITLTLLTDANGKVFGVTVEDTD